MSRFFFRLVLIPVFYSAQLRFEFIKNRYQTPDGTNESIERTVLLYLSKKNKEAASLSDADPFISGEIVWEIQYSIQNK